MALAGRRVDVVTKNQADVIARALDEALADHVKLVFGVMVTASIDGDEAEGKKRFVAALARAGRIHEDARDLIASCQR